MRKKAEKKLKLKRVCARVFMKHKIIASLFSVLLMASAVFTGIECAQALQWGEYWESDWFKHGHNWVVLNALELLDGDGYGIEANEIRRYLEAVIDGSVDADIGTSHHGGYYGVSEDNQYNMRAMGGTPFDGGGLAHFFDPWTHLGIGPTEDLWEFVALGAPLVLLTGHIGIVFTAPIIAKVEGWRNWFGTNAAQAAGRAFNKAVSSWNRGDYERAMYFLGMVLHLIGDFAVPHHAAAILLDGHPEYEEFVEAELKNVLPDTLEAALAANTIYNIGDTDHGIYLEALRSLSDGVYIAGDTDQLTYMDSEGLRKGHIYQLPNPVHQFIDFAAHESLEWYPLANAGGMPDVYSGDYWDHGWDDFDDWWETPNYIEAPNLRKKQQGNAWEDNHFSRLIFHFEGVDRVVADFEGAVGHNYEAIDMENFWGTDLGWVAAFDGYEWFGTGNEAWTELRSGPGGFQLIYHPGQPNQVGGPWVDEGWLYGGPEPAASNTLQLETCVYRGLSASDIDCDGWQLSEINVHDKYHWNGPPISDPLLSVQANPPKYRDSSYNIWDLPLLDAPVEDAYAPQKIAAIHLLDLTSKLIAGMIKYFCDTVDLSVVTNPRTHIQGWNSMLSPYGIDVPVYLDESGKLWWGAGENFGADQARLTAIQGRYVWDGTQRVFEPTGAGLAMMSYQIDDGDWLAHFFLGGAWDYTWPIGLPPDELEHTIRYQSVNKEGQWEPIRTQIFQRDGTPPTAELIFGQPSRQVNGVWHITDHTPITLTALDLGAGVEGIYYSIYNVEQDEWVAGEEPGGLSWSPSDWGLPYRHPFNLGGFELIPYWQSLHMSPEIGRFYIIFPWGLTWTGLPDGTYQIHYASQENLRMSTYDVWGRSEIKMVEVELVDSMEGVDVQVAPYCFVAQPGDSVGYNVSICNWYQTTQTYDLTVEGLDPTWFTFSEASVAVGPDETANVTLTISPPNTTGLIVQDYPFTVTATQQGSPEVSDTAEAILTLVFWTDLPSEPEGSVEVYVEPEPIHVGSAATASIHVVNNQNFDDLIALSIDVDDIPESNQADLTWLNLEGMLIFAPAGSTTTVSLTITVPDDASIGYRMFDVTVKSRTLPSAQATIRVRMGNYPEHALQEIQHLREDVASLYENGTIDQYKHDRILASLAQIEADINSAIDYLDETKHGFDDKAEGLSALKSAASRTEYLIKDMQNWVGSGYMSNDLANEIIQHLESISAAMAYKADYEAESEKMLAVAAIEDAETRGRQVPWLRNQISYIDTYLANGDYWLSQGSISKAVDYYKTAFYCSQRIVINAWHWSWGIDNKDWIDQIEENL